MSYIRWVKLVGLMKLLIFTATYNEAENIERLCAEILGCSEKMGFPEVVLLVVDDSSPDGTGNLLKTMATTDKRIEVVSRPEKSGVGSAHRFAIEYAYQNDFDFLITMDADFSHPPRYLSEFLNNRHKGDYLVASRYAYGGSTEYKGKRLIVSKCANVLAKRLLRLKMTECTSSFRGFSRKAIKGLNAANIRSDGYSYFLEVSYWTQRLDLNVYEFGFEFKDRSQGVSKISKREIFKAIYKMATLSLRF